MLYRLTPNNILFESAVQENNNNGITKEADDMGADLKVKIN